jgi:hypothetical protein
MSVLDAMPSSNLKPENEGELAAGLACSSKPAHFLSS